MDLIFLVCNMKESDRMMLFCRLVASMFFLFFYTGVLIMSLVALGIFSLKKYMGFVNLVIFCLWPFIHSCI